MKTYKVALPKLGFTIGVVTDGNKVIQAHPAIKVKIGANISKVKKWVAAHKGAIVRVYPST